MVDAATFAQELGVSPGNALRPLEPLLTAGVVTELTGRARNRLWQAREVLSALDAFAARSGRRRAGGLTVLVPGSRPAPVAAAP